MAFKVLMTRYRQLIAHWWVVLVFGSIYLISQSMIGVLIEHIGPESFGKLQITAFSSNDYLETFSEWEQDGKMPFYRAHFILDGVHWLWYTISLTALLGLGLNKKKVGNDKNWLLLLPLIGGLCDSFENSIQLIFLSSNEYLTIVDPLPLISTLFSITKWSLVSMVISGITLLFLLPSNKRKTS